jgi:transposase
MRILVAVQPADFRKGIDGLARLARYELASDPFSGTVFVFHNRRRTAVKLLAYDGQGFWLFQKRLSRGHFPYWPRKSNDVVERLKGIDLQVILSGGLPSASAPDWRRIDVPPRIP